MTRIFKYVLPTLLALSISGEPEPAPTGSVSLAWDRVTNQSLVTEIRIYYGTESRHYLGHVALGPEADQLNLSNLELDREYFFAASAFGPGGESELSAEVEWSFSGPPRPRTPVILNFHQAN